MGTTIIKHINEALTNDVLAKDVYSNGRLIITQLSELNIPGEIALKHGSGPVFAQKI